MPPERTYRALLIGNSTYTAPRERPTNLFGPANDVDALRASLTDANWGLHATPNVTTIVNGSRDEIAREVERFFRSATTSDQLFLYYSGHGIQESFERLYLCASDTETDLPTATAVPMETVNALAESTNAIAIVVMLDCCYAGILKGPDPAVAAQGRGRWLMSSCRRDQGAQDALKQDGLSPFTELVAEGLVSGAALDLDEDGFVTVADVRRYVTPRLEERTGQQPTFRDEGYGELAIALAPGYPVEFDQRLDEVIRLSDRTVRAPAIPRATPELGPPEGRGSEPEVPGPGTPETAVVRELTTAIRHQDEVTLRLLLQLAVRHVGQYTSTTDGKDEVIAGLDVLATAAATTLNLGAIEWFDRCVGALRRSYELGFDAHGTRRNARDGEVQPVVLWLAILQRVLALGGLAVRLEAWPAVRELTLQRPEGQDFRYYKNWLRHSLTEAARADLLKIEREGRRTDISPVTMAQEYALGHASLVPDLFDADDERLLTSLCQFDALACVTALCAAPDERGSQFYPNFARFYGHRTEPALALLVTDERVRQTLAPVDHKDLAAALVEVDRVARGEARMFDGWWGYESPAIKAFVAEHLPSN